jgi:DNA repair protein RecO (recombination protein O)
MEKTPVLPSCFSLTDFCEMKVKTRGIILHTIRYRETSLIVKVYTEEMGLASFLVSGVRTSKVRFSGSLFQPLSLVELVASGGSGKNLHRITDISPSPPLAELNGHVIKSSIALFLAEVIYRSIREEESNRALFEFLHNGIQILDVSRDNVSRFHLFFLAQLTRYTGFYPHGNCDVGISYFDLQEGIFCNNPPPHPLYMETHMASLLNKLLRCTFDSFHLLSLTNAEARLLLEALVTYYELHHTHGQVIRSHKVLAEVLH